MLPSFLIRRGAVFHFPLLDLGGFGIPDSNCLNFSLQSNSETELTLLRNCRLWLSFCRSWHTEINSFRMTERWFHFFLTVSWLLTFFTPSVLRAMSAARVLFFSVSTSPLIVTLP